MKKTIKGSRFKKWKRNSNEGIKDLSAKENLNIELLTKKRLYNTIFLYEYTILNNYTDKE